MVIKFVCQLLTERGCGGGELIGPDGLEKSPVGAIRLEGEQAHPPGAALQMLLGGEHLLGNGRAHKEGAGAGVIGKLHQKLDKSALLDRDKAGLVGRFGMT